VIVAYKASGYWPAHRAGHVIAAIRFVADRTLRGCPNRSLSAPVAAVLLLTAGWALTSRIVAAQPSMDARLQVRLVSRLIHTGDVEGARTQLGHVQTRLYNIEGLSHRALLMSQYARLLARIARKDAAIRLFDRSVDMAIFLEGRKGNIARGLIALGQARALMILRGFNTLDDVTTPMVKGPIDG